MDAPGPLPGHGNRYDKTINEGGTLQQGDIYANQINQYLGGRERDECLNELLSTNSQNDKAQIELDKGGLFKEVCQWFLDSPSFKKWKGEINGGLLWVMGDPYTGKTMMLCGIIDELISSTKLSSKESDTLLTFAFFLTPGSNSTGSCTTALAVFCRLICLLVVQQPQLISHVRAKYTEIGSKLYNDSSYCSDAAGVLENMLKDVKAQKVYLVIDALDQCETDLDKLLHFITKCEASSVKWLLSSSKSSSIGMVLRHHRFLVTEDLMSASNALHVSRAVSAYINHVTPELHCVLEDHDLDAKIRQRLEKGPTGSFLWVSQIVQELRQVDTSWGVESVFTQTPKSLEKFYLTALERILCTKGDTASHCGRVLATVRTASKPLYLGELGVLSRLPRTMSGDIKSITKAVHLCGFLLKVQDDGTVVFIHPSAREFVAGIHSYETTWHPESPFWSTVKASHLHLLTACLDIMSENLRRDMYNLKQPDVSIHSIKSPSPNPLAALRYSIVHWADHLEPAALEDTAICGQAVAYHYHIHDFLKINIMFWIEALSLCGQIPGGMRALVKAQQYLSHLPYKVYHKQDLSEEIQRRIKFHDENRCQFALSPTALHLINIEDENFPSPLDRYSKMIHDGYRLVSDLRHCIQEYPLQVYYAALVFGSTESSLFKSISHRPSWVSSTPAQSSWNVVRCCIEGQTGPITSLGFSPSGEKLAVVGEWVQVRNSHTTELQQTLKMFDSSPIACRFIDHEQKLLIVLRDHTIQVWCVDTGIILQEIKPDTVAIESVAFSVDGQYIAYGGQNGTILLQKMVLGTLEPQLRLQQSSSLQGHTGAVISLSFTHDGKSLVSTASDHHIRIWDIRTGASKLLRDTNENSVLSKTSWPRVVTCSPYNDAIAGGFSDGRVLLWETITGGHYRVLKGHTDCILSIAFSQNGSKIATASKDGTVRVWDTELCVLQQTLLSHFGDSFRSVMFSPDDTQIVSGSPGNTICFWDAVIAAASRTRTSSYVVAKNIGKAFGEYESPFIIGNNKGFRLAVCRSHRVQLWAEELDRTSYTLELVRRSLACSAAFSAARQAIAIGSQDGVVSLWDIKTGQKREAIPSHAGGGRLVLGNMIHSVAFSSDGKILASGSGTGRARDPGCDDSVRVWDLEGLREVAVFRGHNGPILALAFSSDNQQLVVVRRNTAPNGNPSSYGIYQYEVVLCHMSGNQRLLFKAGIPGITVYALTLSPDASLLAVASTTGYVDIWDLFGKISGDQRFRISQSVLAVVSHSDSPRGKVWLWDIEARALRQVLEGHKDFILAIEISADGKRLMAVSQDGMVLVWAIDVPPMWETDDFYRGMST
ncbi:hypothetical protein H9Q73_004278 [Fusarium xylarioides]|nr:hypothetical protein H9Q73_004278 [Fusarium xylarioides]